MRNTDRFLDDPRRPRPAPIEFAGKWVAWDATQTRIVGTGVTAKDAREDAESGGHKEVVLQKVRRVEFVFIGGTRQ